MIISVKPCVNCGADKTIDFREYDGCLGYEALICKKCGYIYDYMGAHAPDPYEAKERGEGTMKKMIIWGKMKGLKKEKIDECDENSVDYLLGEYRLAFGNDWLIWASKA